MKNFRLYAVSVGAFMLGALCSFAAGNTYYVDCKLDSYEGERGGSWETAFKTIQEGVEKASSGDTVLVASGDYNEGVRPRADARLEVLRGGDGWRHTDVDARHGIRSHHG